MALDNEKLRIQGYELVSLLGQGGMGVVWKAVDTRLDREVAIKILTHLIENDSTARLRFSGEARSLARLNHPNIVTVYDVGEVNEIPYIVMELVKGITLDKAIRDNEPTSIK